eukprot:1156445-Pelagomonas_calceolata.AAC.1
MRVLFKTGKVLQQRGLEKFAANCEAMRQELEGFKRMVPLVLMLAAYQELFLKLEGLQAHVALGAGELSSLQRDAGL